MIYVCKWIHVYRTILRDTGTVYMSLLGKVRTTATQDTASPVDSIACGFPRGNTSTRIGWRSHQVTLPASRVDPARLGGSVCPTGQEQPIASSCTLSSLLTGFFYIILNSTMIFQQVQCIKVLLQLQNLLNPYCHALPRHLGSRR